MPLLHTSKNVLVKIEITALRFPLILFQHLSNTLGDGCYYLLPMAPQPSTINLPQIYIYTHNTLV